MTSPMSEKIVLRSTSAVSLNERFTIMLKTQQPEPVEVMEQQHEASVGSRILALQMEDRPSVQDALVPRRSLKQRLGVLARLGRPRGVMMQRGGRGLVAGGLRGTIRRGFCVHRARGGFHRTRFAFRRLGQMRGRGSVARLGQRWGLRMYGGEANRSGGLVSHGARNRLGGGRGRRGVALGLSTRGSFWGRSPPITVTKEELDNQLDDYMSKSKRQLDAELDAYMAMAGSDYMVY